MPIIEKGLSNKTYSSYIVEKEIIKDATLHKGKTEDKLIFYVLGVSFYVNGILFFHVKEYKKSFEDANKSRKKIVQNFIKQLKINDTEVLEEDKTKEVQE